MFCIVRDARFWKAAALCLGFLAAAPAVRAQAPPGAKILSRAETVALEHEDRKRRLQRLSGQRLIAQPKFHEYVISKNDLRLKSLPVDIPLLRVVFDTRVFFDFNSSVIRPDARGILETILGSLRKEPPDVALVVAGHTDSVGTDAYNDALGLERARSVAQALVASKIRQVHVFRVSFGEKVPVASNDTEAGMAQNRRVEFLFTAHSNAIAFWLSRQKATLCENDATGCRFEVELEPPRPAPVAMTNEKSPSDLGEKKSTIDIPPPPASPSVDVQPKRYVIDLAEKNSRFRRPFTEFATSLWEGSMPAVSRTFISFLSVALVLAGPSAGAARAQSANDWVGGLVGGIVGGVVGGKIGGNNTSKVIGAVVGVAVGVMIAEELTAAQQADLARRRRAALDKNPDANAQEKWRSADGKKAATITAGPAQPKRRFTRDKRLEDAGRQTVGALPDGSVCRVAQTDLKIDGNLSSGRELWCRTADGDWLNVSPLTS